MILELKINGETEHLTAENELKAIQYYCKDFGSEYLEEMESLRVISEKEAQTIMITSETGETVSLLSLCDGNDFEIVSTTVN